VETTTEQPTTEQPPLQPYTRRNTLNNTLDPDKQYLKKY